MEAFAELEAGLDEVTGQAHGHVALGSQPSFEMVKQFPPGRFPALRHRPAPRRHSETLAVNAVQEDHAVTEEIAQEGAMVPGDAGAVVSAEVGESFTEEPLAKKRRCYNARVVSDLKFLPVDGFDTIAAVYYSVDDSTTSAGLSARFDVCVPLWPVYSLVCKAKPNDGVGDSPWLLFQL